MNDGWQSESADRPKGGWSCFLECMVTMVAVGWLQWLQWSPHPHVQASDKVVPVLGKIVVPWGSVFRKSRAFSKNA